MGGERKGLERTFGARLHWRGGVLRRVGGGPYTTGEWRYVPWTRVDSVRNKKSNKLYIKRILFLRSRIYEWTTQNRTHGLVLRL